MWAEAGMPKVASLTQNRYADALALVESVMADGVDEVVAPTSEEVPS